MEVLVDGVLVCVCRWVCLNDWDVSVHNQEIEWFLCLGRIKPRHRRDLIRIIFVVICDAQSNGVLGRKAAGKLMTEVEGGRTNVGISSMVAYERRRRTCSAMVFCHGQNVLFPTATLTFSFARLVG